MILVQPAIQKNGFLVWYNNLHLVAQHPVYTLLGHPV